MARNLGFEGVRNRMCMKRELKKESLWSQMFRSQKSMIMTVKLITSDIVKWMQVE